MSFLTANRSRERNARRKCYIKINQSIMSFFYSRRHEFATSDALPSTYAYLQTNKVDFLMNSVDLRTKRTTTVSRNATNDFRTESERLAYVSRPYMQFPVFGEGGGGGGLRASTRATLNPHIISETAKDSPSILYAKRTANDWGM